MFKRSGIWVVLAVLLLGSVLLVSSGCGRKKVEKKIVICYSAYAFPEYDKFRASEAKKFEVLRPDVTVKYEPIPGRGYQEKILSQIVSKTAPDVFFASTGYFDYIKKGALLDLTPYVERDKEYFDQIYPALMKAQYYQGRIYSLPGNLGMYVLFYNKKLFDQAGVSYPDETWTWNTMLEAAKKLTKKDQHGRINQFGISGLDQRILMKQNNGEIWNKDKSRCIINSPQNLETLEFMRDFSLKYHVAPGISETKDQEPYRIFMTGRCAMFYGGRWYTAIFKKSRDLDWRVGPIPKKKNRMNVMGFNSLGISADTKYPDISYQFAKFLIRPEGIQFLVDKGDSIPIRWSKEANQSFLNEPGRPKGENKVYLEGMKETFAADHDFFHPAIVLTEQNKIIQDFMERFLLGQSTAEKTLKNIEETLNKMIQGRR